MASYQKEWRLQIINKHIQLVLNFERILLAATKSENHS